ncbi:hypothetical protein BDAP_002481 [Binucleata daphniae]
MVKFIGAHLSISKGLHTIKHEMEEIDANTCAFFIRNPRGFKTKPLNEIEIKKWQLFVKNTETFLPHAPYIINLANKEQHEKHRDCLDDDLERCSILGIENYNIHPGSDVSNLGRVKAIELIANGINNLKNKNVRVVIENTAGDGKKVGSTFEDLRDIIMNVCNKDRVGVCLDTCHLFGAGYDIRKYEQFDLVMKEFDRIVGLKYLKGMHLNDSKMELGSKKDRHECIGKGKIGLEPFKYIMQSEMFDNIPLILETPVSSEYKNEIKILRNFSKTTNT